MTLDSVVQASPAQVSCDLGGEAAILNLNTGVYYGLDPVGARIWTLLAAPTTVAQLRDSVLAEYEVDSARCERDLLDLVRVLHAHGLVAIHDPQPA